MLPHAFDDMAVSDGSSYHSAAHLLHGNLQAHIGHYRCYQGFFLEFTSGQHILGADSHDMIAIDNLAFLVADDQTVAVTVQGKTDIGA